MSERAYPTLDILIHPRNHAGEILLVVNFGTIGFKLELSMSEAAELMAKLYGAINPKDPQ